LPLESAIEESIGDRNAINKNEKEIEKEAKDDLK
jgi:hypothetical protein